MTFVFSFKGPNNFGASRKGVEEEEAGNGKASSRLLGRSEENSSTKAVGRLRTRVSDTVIE